MPSCSNILIAVEPLGLFFASVSLSTLPMLLAAAAAAAVGARARADIPAALRGFWCVQASRHPTLLAQVTRMRRGQSESPLLGPCCSTLCLELKLQCSRMFRSCQATALLPLLLTCCCTVQGSSSAWTGEWRHQQVCLVLKFAVNAQERGLVQAGADAGALRLQVLFECSHSDDPLGP